MDKRVSDVTVQNVVHLLRMRAEIFEIMRGPDPEGEILRWLLKAGWPRRDLTRPNGKPLSPAAETEIVDAGRALRAQLTPIDGGRPPKKPRRS